MPPAWLHITESHFAYKYAALLIFNYQRYTLPREYTFR